MVQYFPLPVFNGPTAFPYFSKLPPEVREMVYDFALPRRVIEINITSDPSWITTTPAPALVHAFQDARRRIFARYRHFTTREFPAGIVVRPSVDIIFFGTTGHIASNGLIATASQSSSQYCCVCSVQRADIATDRDCPACSSDGVAKRLGRYGKTADIRNIVLYDWAYILEVDFEYSCNHNEDIEMNNLGAFTKAFPNLKRILLSFVPLYVPGVPVPRWYQLSDDDRIDFIRLLEETREYRGLARSDIFVCSSLMPGSCACSLLRLFRDMELEKARKLSETDMELPMDLNGESFHKALWLALREHARDLRSLARRRVIDFIPFATRMFQLRKKARQ